MPPSAAVSRGTSTSQAPSARKVGSRTGHANLPSESEVNEGMELRAIRHSSLLGGTQTFNSEGERLVDRAVR